MRNLTITDAILETEREQERAEQRESAFRARVLAAKRAKGSVGGLVGRRAEQQDPADLAMLVPSAAAIRASIERG